MKKIIILALTALTLATTQAEYSVKLKLEQDQGGHLPNGSIQLGSSNTESPSENWIVYESLYSDWINNGDTYGCTWTPDQSTLYLGQSFTQTATDCKQQQTRTVQYREIEENSGAIRNSGVPSNETQIIDVLEDPQEVTGTGTSWEVFANSKGLSNSWNSLTWFAGVNSDILTEIPSDPYPLSSISGGLSLKDHNLPNLNGLSNLTNISGILMLQNNQLTNVDGLSNLMNVGLRLDLRDNPLTNINGLRNLQVQFKIDIDATYAGPKLSSGSRFCTLNDASKFNATSAQKTQLCES